MNSGCRNNGCRNNVCRKSGCIPRRKSARARFSRACLFISVSSVALCFLKHFKRRSSRTIRLTDDCAMPSSRAISLCVEWVPDLSSWLTASLSTLSMLCTFLAVRGRPLPFVRLVVPVASIFRIDRFQWSQRPSFLREFGNKPFCTTVFILPEKFNNNFYHRPWMPLSITRVNNDVNITE